ncbi:MAG: DUF3662 and FHA domain-containing protein [Actinomycetota bacterium]|nr:DUF3662 and FHA domain-containing protein [Actinomycetota bacterium]
MSLLGELEKRLEGLVEGFFAKQFKSGIHPVEIAKGLAREMERKKRLSLSGFIAPSSFLVALSADDFEATGPMRETFLAELKNFVEETAKKEGCRLLAKPQVELTKDVSLSLGEMRVETLEVDPIAIEAFELEQKDPKARLLQRGSRGSKDSVFPLEKETTTIGRLSGCDINVMDQSASRLHAEIRKDGRRYILKDLGSTNGTLLNDCVVESAQLKQGDVITVGKTRLEFNISDV